jgi:hypothetical protein
MLTESERAKRRATVANAIATQRLEGLTVNPETVADLNSFANGDMDIETARRRAIERITARARHNTADAA